jgi:hypothetical protein
LSCRGGSDKRAGLRQLQRLQGGGKENGMPEHSRSRRLSRRAFIRAGILAAGTAALWPVTAPAAKLQDVPRNRTLTLVWTGREGRWIDHELWNPYAIGSNHQSGPGILYEPLAY